MLAKSELNLEEKNFSIRRAILELKSEIDDSEKKSIHILVK
nr:12034_t:CDS:2 [Entrophospora candida]